VPPAWLRLTCPLAVDLRRRSWDESAEPNGIIQPGVADNGSPSEHELAELIASTPDIGAVLGAEPRRDRRQPGRVPYG
jgi:hypothetical protein